MNTPTETFAVSETISRSPADVLRLLTAAVLVIALLVIEGLFGDTLTAFVSDLFRGFSALPQWMVNVLVVATRLIGVAVLVGGLFWTALHSSMRMTLTAVAGIGLAVALVALLGGLVDSEETIHNVEVSSEVGPLTDAGFPTAYGIAALAGALTAAAPWLSRSWRRWGWVAIILLVVTRFVTTPASFDSLASALFGWFAGAAALVALGAPTRRATADGIIRGLDAVGLTLESLKPAGVDARGSTPFFGAAADGSRYFVKALGQDQRSADLLFRIYRTLQRKELGDERPFSSLRRAVEHEAFVALVARDLDVLTPRIRGFATAEPNTFVLAYEAVEGRSLDRLQPEELTDEVLQAIWLHIAHLRRHRIAHRDLRLANVFLADDGAVWMIDFGFSEVAASDLLLANDVAELVASSSVVVGVDRATMHAMATVDVETLRRAAGRLQPWALSGATRTALKQRPGQLDDLRARLAVSA